MHLIKYDFLYLSKKNKKYFDNFNKKWSNAVLFNRGSAKHVVGFHKF